MVDKQEKIIRLFAVLMCTSLWITQPAFGWGAHGHELLARHGTSLADPRALSNCHISVEQITEHTNDPDRLWRNQKFKHPREAQMHYFHVDAQPTDWKKRRSADDRSQGMLVYRIVEWIDEAKALRKEQKWSDLAERLYGLSHYIGDLSQPLHLASDHDGKAAGLPGLHEQFESRMVKRFKSELDSMIAQKLAAEKIPPYWKDAELKDLVFSTAEQSHAKTARLFASASNAAFLPKKSRQRSDRNKTPRMRFEKKALFKSTGSLAAEQIAIGARLWAHVLNSICR